MTTTAMHPQRIGAAAFAVLICLLCLVAALQLSFPQLTPIILPFSESYYGHALAATDSKVRVELAEVAVSAAPNRAENWLLLASARQNVDKDLTGRVLSALRQSYKVGPLAPDAHDWRMEYIFSNWHRMPTDLKSAAMTEAEAYFTRYAGSVYLRHLAQTVPDQEGRVAVGLVLLTHDRAGESARRVAEYRAANDQKVNAEK